MGKRQMRLSFLVTLLILVQLACGLVEEADCYFSNGTWRVADNENWFICDFSMTPTGIPSKNGTATIDILTAGPDQEATPTQPYLATTLTLETSPAQAATPPARPSPADDQSLQIYGKWSGNAQWLCDDNLSWDTILDFKANGIVSATLSGPSDTVNQDGTWILSGNDIELHFQYGTWVGTVDGNAIQGTFAEDTCSGVWSVTRN